MRERLTMLIIDSLVKYGCSARDIADYLIDNGVIVLPCKVGDTVYKLWYKPCHKGEDMPDSYSCCGCEDKCDLERAVFEFVVPSVAWILQHLNAFGDYVWFLTKEEAEAKLAEINNRNAINTEVNYSDAMNVYRELNTHDREESVSELAELKGTEE